MGTRMKKIILLFLLHYFLLLPVIIAAQTIHVFGDSHAHWGFSDNGKQQYTYDFKDKNIPFSVHWLIGKTMFSIGKNGFDVLNIQKFKVSENDIAVYTFGEIDARCHIGKQRDEKQRDVHEIIDSLVNNYIKTIFLNKALYENIYSVVMEVMPPTNKCFNAKIPFYGPLDDRIAITKALNAKLKEACDINNIPFLRTHDIFANPDGTLNPLLSDNCVHMGMKHNYLIKHRLIQLLINLNILIKF